MSAIAVLVEHRRGEVRDVTFEMLSAARGLAKQAGVVAEAYLLSGKTADLAGKLTGQSDRLIAVEHAELAEFNAESYQRVLVKLLAERKPTVLLVAHSAFGTDLAPSLAYELGCGLVSDATALKLTEKGLLVARGMYGGKLMADRFVPKLPALVMVRQSNFKPETPGLATETVNWNCGDVFADRRCRFIALEDVPVTGIDITKAEIVVGIGRGVKEEKNLAPIKEFADSIGAVLAGSRPVVDAGWLPKECQVGSSGKTVKPKLYIALGISGAFQHVAGMKAAGTIIAVNKDPNAPIFAFAQYGIVDDLHKVVPALKAKLTA